MDHFLSGFWTRMSFTVLEVECGNGMTDWCCISDFIFQKIMNKEIVYSPGVGLAFGVGWLDTLCFWSSGTFSGTGNLGLLMSEGYHSVVSNPLQSYGL